MFKVINDIYIYVYIHIRIISHCYLMLNNIEESFLYAKEGESLDTDSAHSHYVI